MIRQNILINFWSFTSESEGISFKLTDSDGFQWLSLLTTTYFTQIYISHYLWLSKASCSVLGPRFFMNQKLCTHQIIIKNWQMSSFTKWLCLKSDVNRTSVMLKNIWLNRPITARILPQIIKLKIWCDWISETFTTVNVLWINWTWKLMNSFKSFRRLMLMHIN